jgi:hypothetical protein
MSTDWKPHNLFTVHTCGEEIVGTAEAHCVKCHQTFADMESFDLHQGGSCTEEECYESKCYHPTEVGLVQAERRSEKTGGLRLVWTRPLHGMCFAHPRRVHSFGTSIQSCSDGELWRLS